MGHHVWNPNQIVAGRFRIIRPLKGGGMGEVYEAEDLRFGEAVAIKTIRPQIASDHRTINRFKQEIRHARKVTHFNVCRIYDLFEDLTESTGIATLFFSMELLPGENLAERLIRGRMSEAEAFPIVEQMIQGLAAAHAAGIIHRDFKSSNVMLVPSENGNVRCVITDFGLARSMGSATSVDHTQSITGEIVGTPDYMAPEQVSRERLTPAADVYALGVVMYEMISGTRPFAGDDPLQVAFKRLHEPPAPLRLHVPDVDPRWEAAILRCLERDPGRRFSRATDVADSLRNSSSRLPEPSTNVRAVKFAEAPEIPTRVLRRAAAPYELLRRPGYRIFLAFTTALMLVFTAVMWRFSAGTRRPSAEAMRWYEEGANDIREGTYYKATKALEHAIQLSPLFPLAHARLAEAWTELDASDRAREAMLKAIVPSGTYSLTALEPIYLRATHHTVNREFESAVSDYTEIVHKSADAEKPRAFLDLGRAYEKNGTGYALDSGSPKG